MYKRNSGGVLRVFFGGVVLTLLINGAVLAAVIGAIWWCYNHVIAPSFSLPQLQVK